MLAFIENCIKNYSLISRMGLAIYLYRFIEGKINVCRKLIPVISYCYIKYIYKEILTISKKKVLNSKRFTFSIQKNFKRNKKFRGYTKLQN